METWWKTEGCCSTRPLPAVETGRWKRWKRGRAVDTKRRNVKITGEESRGWGRGEKLKRKKWRRVGVARIKSSCREGGGVAGPS